jgi:hypothetical protein
MLITGMRHHQRRIGEDVTPVTDTIAGPGMCPPSLFLLATIRPAITPITALNLTISTLSFIDFSAIASTTIIIKHSFPAQLDDFLGDGSARILHQTDRRNAKLLNRILVHSPHLISGYDKQHSSLPGRINE